jgi:hypothetical protein
MDPGGLQCINGQDQLLSIVIEYYRLLRPGCDLVTHTKLRFFLNHNTDVLSPRPVLSAFVFFLQETKQSAVIWLCHVCYMLDAELFLQPHLMHHR